LPPSTVGRGFLFITTSEKKTGSLLIETFRKHLTHKIMVTGVRSLMALHIESQIDFCVIVDLPQ